MNLFKWLYQTNIVRSIYCFSKPLYASSFSTSCFFFPSLWISLLQRPSWQALIGIAKYLSNISMLFELHEVTSLCQKKSYGVARVFWSFGMPFTFPSHASSFLKKLIFLHWRHLMKYRRRKQPQQSFYAESFK